MSDRIKSKVIGIDYDETITDNTPYPHEGAIREEARKYIPMLFEKGYKLVLWTSRHGDDYFSCVDRLKRENLLQFFTCDYDTTSVTGKLIADFYIDDKSIPGELNWHQIYEYIINNI